VRKDKLLSHTRKHGKNMYERNSMISVKNDIVTEFPGSDYSGGGYNPILGDNSDGFMDLVSFT